MQTFGKNYQNWMVCKTNVRLAVLFIKHLAYTSPRVEIITA